MGGRLNKERREYQEERAALEELKLSGQHIDVDAVLALRKPEDTSDAVYIWPEHLEAFEIFCALETQWRIASGFGVFYIGLIYSEATREMRERSIKRERRNELMWQLRVMERAAKPLLNASPDEEPPPDEDEVGG